MGPPISTWPYSHANVRASVTSNSEKVMKSELKCLLVQFVDNFRLLCYNFTFALLLLQVFLSLNSVKAGPVILNLDYLQGPVPLARNIRHLPCISRRTGQEGLCMFAIDCLKANGSHLGTCIDRFYFGSCCQIPDKTVLPQIIGNNIEDNTIDSANFVHPQTEDKIHSTVSIIPSIFPNRKTTTERQTEVTTEKTETVQDRTETIEMETKSDPDREITKLTTPIEATTKSQTNKDHVATEIPIRLSTFQTVSGDISNSVTEEPKTTEVVKETTVTTTSKPIKITNTRKPTRPTYRPKPTYKPSNLTRPQLVSTTTKPRPTRPPAFFNATRKPPYKWPPKRTTTKKPLPSPPRLNITILPQSTSVRPLLTRPSVTSITYINVTNEEKAPTTTTTTTTTSTPSTTTTSTPSTTTTLTPSTTTTEFTTTLVTERLAETTEIVTETATSFETITERVTEKVTVVDSELSSSSLLPLTEIPTSETSSSEPSTPVAPLTQSPVSELPPSEAPLLESSSSESSLSESSSESLSTLNEPLPETSPESILTVTEKQTTLAVEKETLKPVDGIDIPPTTISVVSTEYPPLVTWSTVEVATKAPENITTVSDDKWSPITPPEGWVLISTIPPAVPELTTTTTSTTSTTSTTEQQPPTVQTTLEDTVVETLTSASPTEQATTQTTVTPVTTPTADTKTTESTVTQQPVLEFTVNVTLSPTVPTSTVSVESSSAVTDVTPQNTTESVVSNATETTTQDITNSTTAAPVTTSEGPSFNMSNYKEVCGRRLWPQARIVGGKNSAFGMWPWQISLRQYRTSTYLHKCGAALLNENWAITAAHCVEHVPPSELLVRLGEHDLANDKEPYEFAERRVQIIASHPHFDPATFEYDLALLRFYEPVTFRPNILPVCVPDDDDDFVGKTAYVTGWGRLFDDGPLPSVLQEVKVPVINNSLCEAMYQDAGYNEHIPNIFICAGRKKGGADSCEGDSGGPMVVQRERDNRFVLGGVISWGIGCAEPNQPGVYTRISEFRDWINQILQF